MSYGFQVFNDGGVIQIDENYYNYAVYSKGVATANVTVLQVPNVVGKRLMVRPDTYSEDKVFCANRPFAQAYTSGPQIVVSGCHNNDTQFNFTYHYIWIVPSQSAPSIFPENYGLEVYDSNGVITFSTKKEYFNLAYASIEQFNTQLGANHYSGGVNLHSGKSRYFDFSACFTYERVFNPAPGNNYVNSIGYSFNNSQYYLKSHDIQDSSPGYGNTTTIVDLRSTRSIIKADFY